MKLFIIGNGFDCYLLGLPTKYRDFRNYLLRRFPDIDPDDPMDMVPAPNSDKDGEERFEEEEVASYIVGVFDACGNKENDEWNCLETYLGDDIYYYINDDLFRVDNDGGIKDKISYKDVYNNEDVSDNIKRVFRTVRQFFTDWVRSAITNIDYVNVNKNSAAPMLDKAGADRGENLYLTFNYSLSLEEIYKIQSKSICHIHGSVEDPDDAHILFGHGDDVEIKETSETLGSNHNLNELKKDLRKPTQDALRRNLRFFEKLDKDHEWEIYSYGFSFSDVDMIYLDEIIKRVDLSKATFYLNSYDWKNNAKVKELLEQKGFTVKCETGW